MRSAGVRLTREKLLRFTKPEPQKGLWVPRLIFVGVVAWIGWVLFFSDHSLYTLLNMQQEKAQLARKYQRTEAALARARKELPGPNPTLEERERLLREVHVYAREGEIVYIFGNDDEGPAR